MIRDTLCPKSAGASYRLLLANPNRGYEELRIKAYVLLRPMVLVGVVPNSGREKLPTSLSR